MKEPKPHIKISRIERLEMTLKSFRKRPAIYRDEIMRLERELEILKELE